MERFDVDKETRIVLYGFSNIAKKQWEELRRQGYFVEGVIDRNAEAYSAPEGIALYTPEAFFKAFRKQKDIVIPICLNNGMQHEKVVSMLAEGGYKRCIYIPMDADAGFEFMKDMQRAYAYFMEGRYERLKGIPVSGIAKAGSEQEDLPERNISETETANSGAGDLIEEDGNTVTFLCGIDYLFSADEKMLREIAANGEILNRILSDGRFLDKPIARCRQYCDLFDYLLGKTTWPELYLSYFGRDDQYNERLLQDRKELFACYEKKYGRDSRMFYLQPAAVRWNEKGYFNVCDGLHRLIYLYYVKNWTEVPVKASGEDFEQYRGICMTEKEML